MINDITGDETGDKTAAVADLFFASPEAEEWQAFREAAEAALEKGAGEGEGEGADDFITVPAAFLRRVLGEISANPLMFQHLLEAWNRAADAAGEPGEKR